jgi:hypothetical protein
MTIIIVSVVSLTINLVSSLCIHTYVQEYEEEHCKLVLVVTSMEQNIKALLKDFDSRKR